MVFFSVISKSRTFKHTIFVLYFIIIPIIVFYFVRGIRENQIKR